MELDKTFVKEKVMSTPGVREAIRNNDFKTAFEALRTEIQRSQLARTLLRVKVDFLSQLNRIYPGMFRGEELMTSITIPSNIESIGDLAFFGAPLEEVKFEPGVKIIGESAFAQTKLKEVHLPETVLDVGYMAFGKAIVYISNVTAAEVFLQERRITVNDVINEATGEVIAPRKGV